MKEVRQLCMYIRAGEITKAEELIARMPIRELNQTAYWCEQGWFGSTLFSRQTDSSFPSAFLGKMTPLGMAAAYGQRRIVETLLKKGVDPNARSGRQEDHTPLDCVKLFWEDTSDRIVKANIIDLLTRAGGLENATIHNSGAVRTALCVGLRIVGVLPAASAQCVRSFVKPPVGPVVAECLEKINPHF